MSLFLRVLRDGRRAQRGAKKCLSMAFATRLWNRDLITNGLDLTKLNADAGHAGAAFMQMRHLAKSAKALVNPRNSRARDLPAMAASITLLRVNYVNATHMTAAMTASM